MTTRESRLSTEAAPEVIAATKAIVAQPDDIAPPQRIQFRRGVKGWRLPEGGKLVTRSTKWGNPFEVKIYGRAGAVAMYRAWLLAQPELVAKVILELRGRTLACYCKLTEECHADVLIAVANGGDR